MCPYSLQPTGLILVEKSEQSCWLLLCCEGVQKHSNFYRLQGQMLQDQMVELSNFVEFVVVGDECDGAKPFPDPFAFEDSVSRVKAGVAAGMPASSGLMHKES